MQSEIKQDQNIITKQEENIEGKNKKQMKKIVYVDMDNVLVDFKTGISRLSSQELIIFEDRYDEVPNIFSIFIQETIVLINQLSRV